MIKNLDVFMFINFFQYAVMKSQNINVMRIPQTLAQISGNLLKVGENEECPVTN